MSQTFKITTKDIMNLYSLKSLTQFLCLLVMTQIQAACLLAAPLSLPEKFITRKGLSIENGKMLNQTTDTIKVMHSNGITLIPHADLPPEVASMFGINIDSSENSSEEFPLPNPLVAGKYSLEKPSLSGIDPDGVRVRHINGITKIPYEYLTSELLTQFGPFDSKQAAIFREREKEIQRITYRSVQDAKLAEINILSGGSAQTAPASLNSESSAGSLSSQAPPVLGSKAATKQALLENPSIISDIVRVAISARSDGGKINSESRGSQTMDHTKVVTSFRNISCNIVSQWDNYQRIKLQCLLLTRGSVGNGPLTANVVGEITVDLAPAGDPGGSKTVSVTAEAMRFDSTKQIGTITTVLAKYILYVNARGGEKYIGWCMRAVDGKGRVCGVTSSIPHYDRFGWQTP